MQVQIEPSAAAAAAAAADLVATAIVDAGRPVTFGLAGGSTPRATYGLLRDRPLPWNRVGLWLTDERWVPPGHPESNARMVHEELVDHIGASLLAPDTSLPDPTVAATAYEGKVIHALVHQGSLDPDIVLLGIGEDGHTASLFPGDSALAIERPGCVATWVDAKDAWRITATAPLLQQARLLVFLATGTAKADAITRIIAAEEPLPAGIVAAAAPDVTWILDTEAARGLA